MSFSYDMKLEITEHRPFRTRYREAHANGLFRYAHNFTGREISLRTEHPEVASHCAWLARSILGKNAEIAVGERQRSGKTVYTVAVPDPACREALLRRFSPSPEEMLPGPEEEAAFLAGAFLACGNVTDPNKSYHLEFVVRREELAAELAALLDRQIPGVKRTVRRASHVLYYKECEQIEDLMTLTGASKSCLAMIDVEMIKSVRNRANRATNCETANIDKLVSAAANQVADIRYLLDRVGEEALPENLLEVARLRLENPDLSLRELAEELSMPISRSGVHHRLEKLSKLAAEHRGKEKDSHV